MKKIILIVFLFLIIVCGCKKEPTPVEKGEFDVFSDSLKHMPASVTYTSSVKNKDLTLHSTLIVSSKLENKKYTIKYIESKEVLNPFTIDTDEQISLVTSEKEQFVDSLDKVKEFNTVINLNKDYFKEYVIKDNLLKCTLKDEMVKQCLNISDAIKDVSFEINLNTNMLVSEISISYTSLNNHKVDIKILYSY